MVQKVTVEADKETPKERIPASDLREIHPSESE